MTSLSSAASNSPSKSSGDQGCAVGECKFDSSMNVKGGKSRQTWSFIWVQMKGHGGGKVNIFRGGGRILSIIDTWMVYF